MQPIFLVMDQSKYGTKVKFCKVRSTAEIFKSILWFKLKFEYILYSVSRSWFQDG